MMLSQTGEPPKKVTLLGTAYALSNGNPVVQIKEQGHPVCIDQLEPI